jgi:hypothetical protein
MKSRLRLSDGLLHLSDIIKEPLPNAEFAFLSCMSDGHGRREVVLKWPIHLAAGVAPSRILWCCRDDVGPCKINVAPSVADQVYAQILGDGSAGLANSCVYGLQESSHSFAFWVPFIHLN